MIHVSNKRFYEAITSNDSREKDNKDNKLPANTRKGIGLKGQTYMCVNTHIHTHLFM